MAPFKVIILNGFLGSGKTTLFRNLLTQSKKLELNVAAIVNDMSELDVDGEILGNNSAIEEGRNPLVSIHSCVLSSKKGLQQLQTVLLDLIGSATKTLELIVIETSGSCHPMPLIQFFKKSDKFKLTGVFTLVDSLSLSRDFDSGESLIPSFQDNLKNGCRDVTNLLVEQVLFGSHIFLTKTDRVSQYESTMAIETLRKLNPNASVQVLHFGNMSLPSLLELPIYDFQSVDVLTQELFLDLETDHDGDRPYNIGTRVVKSDLPFHPMR